MKSLIIVNNQLKYLSLLPGFSYTFVGTEYAFEVWYSHRDPISLFPVFYIQNENLNLLNQTFRMIDHNFNYAENFSVRVLTYIPSETGYNNGNSAELLDTTLIPPGTNWPDFAVRIKVRPSAYTSFETDTDLQYTHTELEVVRMNENRTAFNGNLITIDDTSLAYGAGAGDITTDSLDMTFDAGTILTAQTSIEYSAKIIKTGTTIDLGQEYPTIESIPFGTYLPIKLTFICGTSPNIITHTLQWPFKKILI